MSSCLPLILMALTAFLALPRGPQAAKPESIAHLLLLDEIDKAEAAVNSLPRNAETVAFQGEIEFRRGNFAKAESLYRESIRMDDKTARAHFGLGKLALSKLQSKDAVKELMSRAVELAPGEALFFHMSPETHTPLIGITPPRKPSSRRMSN